MRKGFPTEALGITCEAEDHYQVVEYPKITQKSAEKRNQDGAANICTLIVPDFLQENDGA